MKIARFNQDGGDPRYGIVDEDDLVVLAGDPLFSGFETTGERIPFDSVKLLAPVIPRSKVVCVGMNYAENTAELAPNGPDTPILFLKPNTSVIGPGETIQIPPVPGRIVHEGELAVVIGRIAKRVKAADAADYIFGYTIGNDVTARDLQKKDVQFTRAKGFDTFCPLGPWIETNLDPANLSVRTELGGEIKQDGRTSDMMFPVAEIIQFVSSFMTLLPGDVILTGTPAGVGPMQVGDRVSVTIEGIGTLTNPVVSND